MEKQKKFFVRKQNKHPEVNYFFQILGPFSVTEIVSMAKNGGLDPLSEVCPQDEYWFYLSESSEVRKNFFLDQLPFVSTNAVTGEITQPDITLENKIEPEVSIGAKQEEPRIESSQVFSFFVAITVLLCFMSFVWVLRSLRNP